MLVYIDLVPGLEYHKVLLLDLDISATHRLLKGFKGDPENIGRFVKIQKTNN